MWNTEHDKELQHSISTLAWLNQPGQHNEHGLYRLIHHHDKETEGKGDNVSARTSNARTDPSTCRINTQSNLVRPQSAPELAAEPEISGAPAQARLSDAADTGQLFRKPRRERVKCCTERNRMTPVKTSF